MQSEWVQPADGTTRWQFTATPEMAPNVYVHVTFLQPHLQTANDLPIRLYGVVPVIRGGPAHRTSRPSSSRPTRSRPGETVTVTVKEAKGREMTYTLAIVDEGLLRLTGYSAPDPWTTFYRREASQLHDAGTSTTSWPAPSPGKLERLLAVGGGDETRPRAERKANRFPPVVRFVGPVTVAKGGGRHARDRAAPVRGRGAADGRRGPRRGVGRGGEGGHRSRAS